MVHSDTLQNVAIISATGFLGEVIIPALLASGFTVTCITRPSSNGLLPDGVSIRKAEYTSLASLTAALRGQDVLVEAFNPGTTIHQQLIIQAASTASVKHIITPDFSADTFNSHLGEIPIFEPKLRAKRELETYIAVSDNNIAWTAIVVGVWHDWAIEKGIFWVNREKREITRYGSGNQRYSISRRALAGEALIAVLTDPIRFRNRPAYFASHTVTTNQIIDLLKGIELDGWSVVDVALDQYLEETRKLWQQDTVNGVDNRVASKVYPMYATAALMDETNRYGADFSSKVEAGWDEGQGVLKGYLNKLFS